MMDALLSLTNLSVHFGGVQAVNNLSFEIQKKELLGLIGPNGAGKTTVMRAMTGAVTPTTGTVYFQNMPINELATFQRVRLGIGLSQQIVKPFTNMSALENVVFAAGGEHTRSVLRSLTRFSRSSERDKAQRLLRRLDIDEYANYRPYQLPLGVLKRLELARVLSLDPKLLLLDEPLAGLNHVEASKIADTIADLVSDDITVVLIEHNLGEVVRVCSRLIVIDNGMKISEGTPSEVVADEVVRAAYVGS